jgi:N-methylhydantoinase A
MRYEGQAHSVLVPLPEDPPSKEELREKFLEVYLQKFSEQNQNNLEIDNVKVTVSGLTEELSLENLTRPTTEPITDQAPEQRQVYFDDEWYNSEVYYRENLQRGTVIDGPAIIEQEDTTTVVTPNLTCTVDKHANLLLQEEQ